MTVKETADLYKVRRETIQRWISTGRIKALQPAGPRGKIFIPRETPIDEARVISENGSRRDAAKHAARSRKRMKSDAETKD